MLKENDGHTTISLRTGYRALLNFSPSQNLDDGTDPKEPKVVIRDIDVLTDIDTVRHVAT